MNYQSLTPSNSQTIFLILSILGWLTYIICGWIAVKYVFEDLNLLQYSFIITIIRTKVYEFMGVKIGFVLPIQMLDSILYTVIILTLALASLGFIVFIVKSLFKKDSAVVDGMLGNMTKFHFVSLLIAGGLFLIGVCYRKSSEDDGWKQANIAGIILVILGLASLVFIYNKTNLGDDLLSALIKKGAYSSLIAVEWYYFCYVVSNLVLIDSNSSSASDNYKNCNIAMPIVEGIVALAFAYFFKDVIVALMNALIFLGAAIYFLSMDKDYREKSGGHESAEGIIDIIFAVLSLVVAVVLIFTKKKECLK